MKIIVAQPLPCIPPLNGVAQFNRRMLQAFAERNHACRLLGLVGMGECPEAIQRVRDGGTADERPIPASSGSDVYHWDEVEVHVVSDGLRLWAHLREQIRLFNPDCVLVAEDRTFIGVATAVEEAAPRPVIYFAFSSASLPFGPECFLPDPAKTDILRRVAAIFVQSNYMRDYIRRWSGLDAHVVSAPVYGRGPFRQCGHPNDGFVTLVNPSQLKGVCIFQELASIFSDIAFAAVPTWATTEEDCGALRRLANVRLLPPSAEIDEIFAQTRVLLVPSLWGEAYGLIATEAMLRGIPVLASNIGGLPEAKLGIEYLLPVNPIEHYHRCLDDRALPIPVTPKQDIAPWAEALRRLVSDPAHYRELSMASRSAALDYASGLAITGCEEILEGLLSWRTNHGRENANSPTAAPCQPESASSTRHLSSERLELLAALVKETQKS